MYPGTVMDIVPEMPRPYDGACYYCFHYELPLETQKKILEETIKQRTESYKCHCLTKRHGGFMAGGLFIPQWIDWSRISGKESTIGSMLYFRYLKQLLKDLENRMEILDE